MPDSRGRTYAKKPQPVDLDHDCKEFTALVEKRKPKHGPMTLIYQCAECGKLRTEVASETLEESNDS